MMPRTFNLSTGADTGGVSIRLVEAFRLVRTGWVLRAMVTAMNYIRYPVDIPYSRRALEAYYDDADVIHLNHTLHGYRFFDAGQGKPVVLMHHGLHRGHFDVTTEEAVQEGISLGVTQICSTANLELLAPGVITWVPVPYNLNAMRKLRARVYQPSDEIRIAHAPTDRAVKSTDAFIAAIDSLRTRGFRVKGVLIERVPHRECLIQKAHADILVDQLKLGYGCNAIEAWAYGMPVVGGVEDPSWRDHFLARWGRIPFLEATEQTLEGVLEQLILSADLRAKYSEIGTSHVERFHSPSYVVPLLTEIYRNAQPTPIGHRSLSKRQVLPPGSAWLRQRVSA